ncbi:DNA polymerase-4 [Nocardioides albertanoniae]|uniref:DNA polymerase IV n=1 Tax=Nocardioides albertanoniae TaxID=1175486 RepID=A0A543A9E9_9ACTN|nr:DNA polymerase IV [Nocardioides albertanoniae]TQL69238.1 DNA polymerase-4 [Nocardioides albertanoniae]
MTSSAGAPEVTPILHVDMDAFFVSVAIRHQPELWQQPVVVGGHARGVVTCANYPARAYGIHAAMPGSMARRLCPQLVSVRLDFGEVSEVSQQVREIFRRATPLVEVVSVDEAFLDVRGATRLFGSPERIAHRIRRQIADELKITCSVGVAPTPSVAKVGSRKAKPDGVVVVRPDDIPGFLHPLDVGELYGVGPSTRNRLRKLGFETVGDIARTPVPALHQILGPRLGGHLHRLATGTDRRELTGRLGPDLPETTGARSSGELARPLAPSEGVTARSADRSTGAQETFARDLSDRDDIVRELLRLSARVTRRMRRAGTVGRTVALTVRFTDFTTISRSRTLTDPTDVTQEVHTTAVRLFDDLQLRGRALRLVGVRVEHLVAREGTGRQLVIGERERGWSEADRAVDRVADRFGSNLVRRASLI